LAGEEAERLMRDLETGPSSLSGVMDYTGKERLRGEGKLIFK